MDTAVILYFANKLIQKWFLNIHPPTTTAAVITTNDVSMKHSKHISGKVVVDIQCVYLHIPPVSFVITKPKEKVLKLKSLPLYLLFKDMPIRCKGTGGIN